MTARGSNIPYSLTSTSDPHLTSSITPSLLSPPPPRQVFVAPGVQFRYSKDGLGFIASKTSLLLLCGGQGKRHRDRDRLSSMVVSFTPFSSPFSSQDMTHEVELILKPDDN
jgi:hypothetical protein